MKMTVHGRPSHSGVNHAEGRSAILEAAHQIIKLQAMTDYQRDITVNIGLIKGGTGQNVVPGECQFDIDVRIATEVDAEEMVERVRALQPHGPDVSLAFTGGIGRPPFEESPAGLALFARAQEEARELGMEIEGGFTGGGSDGNFTAAMGVPTLDGLGVIGAGAHTLEEYLLISSLMPRTSLLARLFQNLS